MFLEDLPKALQQKNSVPATGYLNALDSAGEPDGFVGHALLNSQCLHKGVMVSILHWAPSRAERSWMYTTSLTTGSTLLVP